MSFADLAGELPKNWPQVCGLITILGYMVWRDWRKSEAEARRDVKLGEVHDQTVNSHPPEGSNLRDDLDRSIGLGESSAASGAITVRMVADFRDEMRAGFKQIGRDIGGLREEMRTERIERIEGDRRRGEG